VALGGQPHENIKLLPITRASTAQNTILNPLNAKILISRSEMSFPSVLNMFPFDSAQGNYSFPVNFYVLLTVYLGTTLGK
jgi:hypothetical protein